MAQTPSTMLALGTQAPPFTLQEPATGRWISSADFTGKAGLLVAFICNHCPYVIHIRSALSALGNHYYQHGLGVVAINSNDVVNYPADSPEKMREEVALAGYAFPYLYDETQAVAKQYQAACTPDFFLFDADVKLVYRGQFDNARPRNTEPVTGADLRAAIEALLARQPINPEQKTSLGCNIKWKPGNEPNYFA